MASALSSPRQDTMTRPLTPELLETPAPSGKYESFAAYVRAAIHMAGSADALGKLIGFTSGTRISDWRRGRGGRPSIASCLRLAKLTSDSPLDILVMGGYQEEANLLVELGFNPDAKPQATHTLELLQTKMRMLEAKAMFEAALKRIEEQS